jgi:hypothetical protein
LGFVKGCSYTSGSIVRKEGKGQVSAETEAMCKTTAADNHEGALMVANPYPIPEPTKIEDFKTTHDACGMTQEEPQLQESGDIIPDDECKTDARVEKVRKMMLKLL